MSEEIKLWPVQQAFENNIIRKLSKHDAVIACSPGGTGKTKTFIHMARRAMAAGRAALIITDRKKVFNQVSKEAGGTMINDKTRYVPVANGRMYVGMVKCMNSSRRQQIIDDFNKLSIPVLVILDECHFSTANDLLGKLTNKLLVGFTATPHVRWAKHLPIIYKDIVITKPIDWFINNEYLCNYQHIMRSADISGLEKRGGEYTEESQERVYGGMKLYKGLFEDMRAYPFKKAMVFCASIRNAEETFEQLTHEGFKCSIGHSKRQDEAIQLARFMELDETNVFVSVGSYATGFDFPLIDMVVLYRATTSLPLYLQMCFRGNRKKAGMFFRVLDYGENGKRHKPYYYNHEWETLWKVDDRKKKSRNSDAVDLIKICIQCESMISPQARVCSFCNTEQPLTERELAEGKLIDLTADYNALKGRKLSSLDPEELATYAKILNKANHARRAAIWHEQSGTPFLDAYCKAMGYHHGWANNQRQFYQDKQIDFYDVVLK